jgi:Na+(H+)/acetate symporter ActP
VLLGRERGMSVTQSSRGSGFVSTFAITVGYNRNRTTTDYYAGGRPFTGPLRNTGRYTTGDVLDLRLHAVR